MLSRSRSMFKDRGCSSVAVAVGESPRPSRFQPPRSSYEGASNLKKPAPSCSRDQAVVADRRKASSAVAPEPFLVKASRDDMPAPLVLVASKERDLPYRSGAISPAGCANEDSKSNVQEHVDRSPDKFGSEEITGDSDTEPSYVYVKKDSDEQIPGPPPPETPAAAAAAADDAEEEFRRESSESLYSNVQSSFSPRSELASAASSATTGSSPRPSATAQSPEASVSPRPRKSAEAEEGAEKRVPAPTTTPRSSAQSPMDAVNGLKRLLTFGKRSGNGKASEAAAAPRAPPARDGDSSTLLDNSYVISPNVGSLQSIAASSELKEPVLHAKSPRVHRSFFSLSSFKSGAN
ncbi:endochitinase A-like [Zea mays]|uniref:Uncharacterized protein n=1 Tax=Zea mays TaxID=4577 RepID=A0A804PVN3_MAIZE|nr:endochitinase A-like [Zea mays]|eukprot:XP_008649195.1 endochitinase A-like [Zea mays]